MLDNISLFFNIRLTKWTTLIIPNYSQQDAKFLDLFIFTGAVHVSGGSAAHHQEHITVQTAAGITDCNERVK